MRNIKQYTKYTLLVFLLCFNIVPVSAIDYDYSVDFTAAGEMGPYTTDHILVHTTSTLYDYDTVSNTYEPIIYDLPSYHDTFYYNGDIYISLASGVLIRFTGSEGESYTEDPESFESLHTVTDTAGIHTIVVDSSGYVYMTGGDSVYRFDPTDNFNDSLYVYIPYVQYDICNNARCIALHPDGIVIGQYGWYSGTNKINVFLYDGDILTSIANESHYYGSDIKRFISQVAVTESGNIFFSYTVLGTGSWTLYYNETLNTSDTIYSESSAGFYLNSSGYLYSSHQPNNKIVWYNPVEDEGGYVGSPSYITWTTHPPDSWKVGNYSAIVIGVPEEYKNFTFEYKTPSTNYTTMPIQKNIIPKTYNYEEGKWYYWFSKAVYHSTHGDYSCRITHSGMGTETKTASVPYFDPDVTLPPVVIIPIPDVWVDPPQWNVTIPDKYQNVSWLTNYTVFWDGVGNSTNYTLYATVGLLLTPIEMLNSSISTVHEYATVAGGMIAGFEHTAVIIKVGWDIIPDDIQNIFIGTAALGIVIFIYHRRT